MAIQLNTYLIPLTNVSQQFTINLAGINYILICKFNAQPDAGWVLDISDSSGNPLIFNLPIITGGNILDGLDYLGFGGILYAFTNGAVPTDVPTLSNLGVDSNLYFQTSSSNG